MRYHMVVTTENSTRQAVHDREGAWKDLWGWVSEVAAAKATINALTVPESMFPNGHEAFFVAARTICQQTNSLELLKTKFPKIEIRANITGNASLYDTSKAERLLGWKEDGWPLV